MLSVGEELKCLCNTLRSLDKTFALWVFAQKSQDFLVMFRYLSGNVFAVDFVFYVCHFVYKIQLRFRALRNFDNSIVQI